MKTNSHHFVKMDLVQNMVITSGRGDNPAKLNTHVEPIKLDKHMGLAITSFSHGEVSNIYDGNNKIYVQRHIETVKLPGTDITAEQLVPIASKKANYTRGMVRLKIPVGRYKTTLSILKEIEIAIKTHYGSISGSYFTIKSSRSSGKIILSIVGIDIFVDEKSDSPWSLLDISNDLKHKSQYEMENKDLLSGIQTAFLYVNIVENSYINGKLSRNLSVLPLSQNAGCSFYEFKNPSYIPIEVKNFSEILLEIRNTRGDYAPINPNCNTVITLHLKPINRIN